MMVAVTAALAPATAEAWATVEHQQIGRVAYTLRARRSHPLSPR